MSEERFIPISYVDFVRDVAAHQGEPKELSKICLLTAAKMVENGAYGCVTGYVFPSVRFLHGVQNFEHYQSLMKVTGTALYLANCVDNRVADAFMPGYIRYAESQSNMGQAPEDMPFNDIRRNAARLFGYLKDERVMPCLFEIIKSRVECRGDSYDEPWYVDQDIAVLDSIAAFRIRTPEWLTWVRQGLEGLSGPFSDVASARLEEVLSGLEVFTGDVPDDEIRLVDKFLAEGPGLVSSDSIAVVDPGFKPIPKDLCWRLPHWPDPIDNVPDYFSIEEALELSRVDYDVTWAGQIEKD